MPDGHTERLFQKQSPADVDEMAGQAPPVPRRRSHPLLRIGAVLVADLVIFPGEHAEEQDAG